MYFPPITKESIVFFIFVAITIAFSLCVAATIAVFVKGGLRFVKGLKI